MKPNETYISLSPFREPYNTKTRIELTYEELNADNINIFFYSGRLYEVVVFSINGAYKTDSDTQEIFIEPSKLFRFGIMNQFFFSIPKSSIKLKIFSNFYGATCKCNFIAGFISFNFLETTNTVTGYKDSLPRLDFK